METLRMSAQGIVTLCDFLLCGENGPLEGEQHDFTHIIRENAVRFCRDIVAPGEPDHHELQTPLCSIIGYADLLLSGIVGEMQPVQVLALEGIFETGHQLRDAVREIGHAGRKHGGTK